ncbi:MAG: alanine--tRNA ligase [Clostridiales bacterium]|nr:alanine--tRNA ligase [Clostridiales bacterium]
MKIDLKNKYIQYFLSKGHAKMESASVVPENDPSSLFITAGMQPLVPYLLGAPHPLGRRITDYQKCFRLTDLDLVGDKTHHTFFEMLGNWSLGDYFKEEAVAWSYEFLTQVLSIPPARLAVTVFEGNEVAARDEETAALWKKAGIPEERIAYLPAEDNWWPSFEQHGPCGSDTEIFYWSDNENPAPAVYDPSDKRWVEIWNNVFMQYNHTESGEFEELAQKNVDTGMGVERTTAALEGVDDNYLTEIWQPIIAKICALSGKEYKQDTERAMRIVADHMRAVVMIAADGANILPSNKDQGYILRMLIRRMLRYAKMLEIDITSDFDIQIASVIADMFADYYVEVKENFDQVVKVLVSEKEKFAKTIERGLKETMRFLGEVEPGGQLAGEKAFRLFDTFGFPIEMTVELAGEKGISVDTEGFQRCFAEHQEKSRKGSEHKFKGGLADSGAETAKLHTATHLLQGALRTLLGEGVQQKGSNITAERLRFDFSFDRKVTREELDQAEAIVNQAIAEKIDVIKTDMPYEEAQASGALGFFKDKYNDVVSVYEIPGYSKEICGGPHAQNTAELGHFKIVKEEACSSGVRRIKAILD